VDNILDCNDKEVMTITKECIVRQTEELDKTSPRKETCSNATSGKQTPSKTMDAERAG
jgi:hypothetical protein